MSPSPEQALLIALKALRRSDRLEAELKGLLESKDCAAPLIESTLDRIRRWGFLDDDRVIREWAESFVHHGRGGRNKLVAVLVRRGVDESEAETLAGALLDDEDERKLAERALQTKKPKSPGQAFRSLVAKGFSESAAEEAVRGYFGEAVDDLS